MNQVLKRVLWLAVMVALAGCNTIHGMGQDIQNGGAAIEKAASK
jgi:predicted small secreted protein